MATGTFSVLTRAHTSGTSVSEVINKDLERMGLKPITNESRCGSSVGFGASTNRFGGFGCVPSPANCALSFGAPVSEVSLSMPSNAHTSMSIAGFGMCGLPRREFSIDSGEQYERTFFDKSKQHNLIHISISGDGVYIYNINVVTNTLYANFIPLKKFKSININDFAGLVYENVTIEHISHEEYEKTVKKCSDDGFFERFEKELGKKYRFLNHTEFMAGSIPKETGMCWFMNTYCIYVTLYQLDNDTEKARIYSKYMSSRAKSSLFPRLM